eukprot:jgi/Galph1/5594/GphlegSOOS_G4290.1
MLWDEELSAYTYQCPCGDLFQITLASSWSNYEELSLGEEIARCPSCSLVIRVIYNIQDFTDGDTTSGSAIAATA